MSLLLKFYLNLAVFWTFTEQKSLFLKDKEMRFTKKKKIRKDDKENMKSIKDGLPFVADATSNKANLLLTAIFRNVNKKLKMHFFVKKKNKHFRLVF